MKFYLTAIIFCFISLKSFSQTPQIELKLFSSGWTSPIDIKNCGDSRLFIVQQKGYVYICDSLGIKNPIAFLDISAKTATDAGGERGMLGIVFHPDYFNNGHFFVYYTKKSNGDLIVARYNVDSTNKNLADPNSELILLQVPHPTYGNHNGGCLQFGPDGYLYTGMGDGGSGGDPNENAQNPQKYLGKLLRIDVNSETGYVVPPDNPFINDPSFLPEIWTYGMRNPWRFSFDKITGDLWVGDVGQNTWEEVDYVEAPDSGGQNYGWDCYEATHDYEPLNCNASDSVLWPVYEYKHNGGSNGDCSITGGYVYRGSQYANMYGKYIFADYCSGIFRCIVKNNDGTFTTTNVGDELITQDEFDFSTFGVSNTGELYVADISHGKIYLVTDTSSCNPVSQIIIDNGAELSLDSITCINNILSTPYGIGLQYQWQLNGVDLVNEVSPSIVASLIGAYTVVVTNLEGCSSTSAGVTTGASSTLSISGIENLYCLFQSSDSLIGEPAGGVFAGDGVTGNTFDPTLAGLGIHTITYTFVNEFGCTSSTGVVVTVDACLGLNNLWDQFGINIFPNPTDGMLNFILKNPNAMVSEISVYNVAGQKVYGNVAYNFPYSKNSFSINLSSLANGVYELKMIAGNNLLTQKIVISHW